MDLATDNKVKIEIKTPSRNRESILFRERPVTDTVSYCKSVVDWTQYALR